MNSRRFFSDPSDKPASRKTSLSSLCNVWLQKSDIYLEGTAQCCSIQKKRLIFHDNFLNITCDIKTALPTVSVCNSSHSLAVSLWLLAHYNSLIAVLLARLPALVTCDPRLEGYGGSLTGSRLKAFKERLFESVHCSPHQLYSSHKGNKNLKKTPGTACFSPHPSNMSFRNRYEPIFLQIRRTLVCFKHTEPFTIV